MNNKVIVIGGGAAGMMASIMAKRNGADVTLLERNNRVGRKLLATGNGRCNYTNIYIDINNYHGKNPKFAYSPLSKFDMGRTIDFFESLGITPAVEEDGKVFPLSFQSSSVLDVLRFEMDHIGVELVTEAYVVDVYKNKEFVVKLEDGRIFKGEKLILATGGMAMPASGSDGNGYSLAKKFGHKIISPFPGLVQLKLEGNMFKQITGVKNVGIARLYHKNKLIIEDKGDILFTNYGISGPPILQISRTANKYLEANKEVELRVSIIHTKTEEELKDYLKVRFELMPEKNIEEGLIGLINKKLILPILKAVNIHKNKSLAHISNEEIDKLSKILTSWSFKVIGSQSWGHAQVTAGGVDTGEINSSTMESKLVKDLYIVGELLDIDGDCGGFNLQWAWSTGYLAGIS